MLGRIWHTAKVSLAVAALVAAALISADKLDREHAARRTAAADPVETGSLGRGR